MVSPVPLTDHPRQIIGATLIVAAVIAGFAVACYLSDVLFSLFIGIVLATALKPIIEAIQGCGIRQSVAVGAVYSCIILLLVLVLILGILPLINRGQELVRALPQMEQRTHQWLTSAGNGFWASVLRRLVDGLSLSHFPLGPEQSLTTVGQGASYVAMLADGLLAACLVVLLAFYWSLQGDRTIRWLLLLFPATRREGIRDTISEIEGKLGAYLRGQSLVCLAMAGMAATVYGLLGIRYAILLALVAGVLEVMPVLGPILGAIPPLGVAIFTDPGKTTWVLAAAILMQQVESYLIVPRIMDKSVGVHPMVTLLAIAGFGSLLGLGGAILAIPLAAIVQVLLNRYFLSHADVERGTPDGRGPLSVLQYDLRNLVRDIRVRDSAGPPADKVGHLKEAIEAIARDLDVGLKEVENQGEAES